MTNFQALFFSDSIHDFEYLQKNYDSKVNLVYLPLNQITQEQKGLLGNIKVHPTRESLQYSFALLKNNNPIDDNKAIDIIEAVLSLQVTDCKSLLFGSWFKYYESQWLYRIKINYKNDKNWAEFIAISLLELILVYKNKIHTNSQLYKKIKKSIINASLAIHNKQVSYKYSNIYILGFCINLVAGVIFQTNDLYERGVKNFNVFYKITQRNSCFYEYNSPVYTIVALKAIHFLRLYINLYSDNEIQLKQRIEDIYMFICQQIDDYFHPTTNQWSGPHSRNYSTLLNKNILHVITKSKLVNIEKHRNIKINTNENCLPQLLVESESKSCLHNDSEHLLPTINQSKTIISTLVDEKPRQILTTYITPEFTLGTVNYSDLWNQRRSLLAYWGNTTETFYLHLRCLHNYKDFAVAQFYSVQDQGCVLAGINFATDIEKTNPYLHQNKTKNIKIFTRDIRLRFEIGNFKQKLKTEDKINDNSTIKIYCDNLSITIKSIYKKFDSYSAHWKITVKKNKVYIDLVLFSSIGRIIEFSKLHNAGVGFILQIENKNKFIESRNFSPVCEIKVENNILSMKWAKLSLNLGIKPDSQQKLQNLFYSYITNS